MSSRNFLVRLLSSLWYGVDGVRKILHLLLLLALFIAYFGVTSGSPQLLPQSAALFIQPLGPLVDQLDGDAYERALAELLDEAQPQTLVQDVVDALTYAKNDDNVLAVHMELSGLGGGGLSKLRRIGAAMDAFRESDKPLVVSADYFDQAGYYLASHADELYMHPEGIVLIQGYGSFRQYYKEALETLRIDWNVFRVGTHKSFVEPYTRTDMSPEDRESISRLLGQFWTMYQSDVETARGLEDGVLGDFVQNLVAHTKAADGDLAIAARQAGLVDELLGRAELRAILQSYAGVDSADSGDYSAVHMSEYLSHKGVGGADVSDANIAVVIAAGEILDGSHPAGTIGGDSTAALLQQALADDSVKAVVLRVDSPGGSVFASEVIAHEIKALQAAGKPVVASMGSVAASGGYWISVVADRVIASPATITGSIGVFGMFPTFERSLSAIGVRSDGIGTTPWAGQLQADRSMSEPMKQLFQMVINDTYDDFISGVADLREMDKTAVDSVAQGQVWTGQDALEHGLIDELGSFEDSVHVAAELSGLQQGKYGQIKIETRLSPTEQVILDFLSVSKRAGLDLNAFVRKPGALQVFTTSIEKILNGITRFNDPKGVYAHCFCEID